MLIPPPPDFVRWSSHDALPAMGREGVAGNVGKRGARGRARTRRRIPAKKTAECEGWGRCPIKVWRPISAPHLESMRTGQFMKGSRAVLISYFVGFPVREAVI